MKNTRKSLQISRNFHAAFSVPSIVKLAHALLWFSRSWVVVAAFAAAFISAAEPTNFISTLSSENKTAAGITRLTEPQIASLEAQVQHEIAVARQGDTVAFSTSFTHRRSPMQRSEAGLDQLMTPELNKLDSLVAAELTNRPKPAGPLILAPATAASSATPGNYVELLRKKMEIHGEVTLAYVAGSGGAHGYGASMVTTATDPTGKYSFTIGLSQFYGKGLGYGYGYGCRRYPYSPYYYDGYDYDRW